MPIAEWEDPFLLVTPQGTLAINDKTQLEGAYLLEMSNCDSGDSVRSTIDNVPQGDGSILHAQFLTGYGVKLAFEFWVPDVSELGDVAPACATSDPTSQSMTDLLLLHLRAILDGGGRLLYTPNGQPTRLLDSLRWVDKAALTEAQAATGLSVTLASEFPYMQDFEQTTTDVDPSATITNGGNSPYDPVIQVNGPFSSFTITNESALDLDGNPLKIVYDSDLPGAVPVGAGHYIEINTFQNSAFLDGDGADLQAGIMVDESDFWPLLVGDNSIVISNFGTLPVPSAQILWANAWV